MHGNIERARVERCRLTNRHADREQVVADAALLPRTPACLRTIYSGAILAAWTKSVQSTVDCGRILIEAKGRLRHGEFGRMIAEDLPFSWRTAQCLMQIARHPALSNAQHAAHLPHDWSTLAELARLPPDRIEGMLRWGWIYPEMSRWEIHTPPSHVQLAMDRQCGRYDSPPPAPPEKPKVKNEEPTFAAEERRLTDKRAAFLVRAEQAMAHACYSGAPDDDLIEIAKAVARAWASLAYKIKSDARKRQRAGDLEAAKSICAEYEPPPPEPDFRCDEVRAEDEAHYQGCMESIEKDTDEMLIALERQHAAYKDTGVNDHA